MTIALVVSAAACASKTKTGEVGGPPSPPAVAPSKPEPAAEPKSMTAPPSAPLPEPVAMPSPPAVSKPTSVPPPPVSEAESPTRKAGPATGPPADHVKSKHGTLHKLGYKKPLRDCTSCHGPDLKGADKIPSCYKCHGREWH